MKIAKVENGQVMWIREHTDLFGSAYVTMEDLTNNGYTLCSYRQFNPLTEKSAPSDPVFDKGMVWMDTVVPLSEQEIEYAKAVALNRVRSTRDALLAKCDFTQLADYPHTNAAEWAAYRQALRDLPESIPDARLPFAWPTPPTP